MTKHRNPACSEEYRREAVRRSELPNQTTDSVAKELGISAQQSITGSGSLIVFRTSSLIALMVLITPSLKVKKCVSSNVSCQKSKRKRAFKEDVGVLREAARVKYALMVEFRSQYTLCLMCRVMGVSRSGFYKWIGRDKSVVSQRRETMKQTVIDTYQSYKARYGAPRIAKELNAVGIPCSLNYIASLMQTMGVKARNGKAFKYGGSVAAMINVADNLLKRNFTASKPNQKWVSDITYIWVKREWMYLATVMDLYSRKIVGRSLDTQMTESLIREALRMAFNRREVEPGLIIHSDRGVQYRSIKYQDFIRRSGGQISMSRKANCWDNAAMESFFSRLKVELVYAEGYHSIEEAKSGIFEKKRLYRSKRTYIRWNQ